jgi:antitoxin VapB
MPQTYTTRQFQAGNSQAVRLPANMAFPPKTELIVTREGEKIIVQPVEKTMESVPQLFAALKQHAIGGKLTRPEFVEAKRNWRNAIGNTSGNASGSKV